jgi:hypothetical protein
MKNEPCVAIREESVELRSKCCRLREHSRVLRLRSEECRQRLTRVAEAVDGVANVLASGRETDGAARIDRLTRAENDLRSAIAECSSALADVHRELEWRHAVPASIVH